MSKKFRKPGPEEQAVLEIMEVRLLESHELEQCNQLLDPHHYLQSPKPVGERLYYVAIDARRQGLALGILVAGLLRRLGNSLFMEWRSLQLHPPST